MISLALLKSGRSPCPVESGFYYLQSRYYDPNIGRFINADRPEIAALEGSDLTETNLFSYCNNNPVNKSDVTGMLSNWGKVAIGVGNIAAAALLTVATGGAAAGTIVAAVHCVAAGALEGAVIGAVTGAVTGAVEGAIVSRITTGNWSGAVDAAWDGMATGFMTGAITGAITGALTSPYCFVAGTSVLTATGAVAIEKIRAGDFVWAWDEETGQTALKEVLETYVNETDELIHVYAGGEEIITTPGHPFYAPHKGWTEAADLRAGDILVLVNGEYVVVEKIQHELLEAPIPVYNFNVDGFHTYFVTNLGVLVHNRCTGSYEIQFESGKNYVGKGSEARMNVSARTHAAQYGDKVVSATWTPASDTTNAFVDEYFKMAVRGVNNANTYNKIWSPGRSIVIKAFSK